MIPVYQKFGLSKDEFEQQLRDLNSRDATTIEIGAAFNISAAAAHSWLKKFNIPRRRSNLRDPELLRKLYFDDNQSLQDIATQLGVTYVAVSQYFDKLNIPKRTGSERQRVARKAKPDRFNPPRVEPNQHRSCGYRIRYQGVYFASCAEFAVYLLLNANSIAFEFQPAYPGRLRPDFKVADMYIEVKSGFCDDRNIEYYSSQKTLPLYLVDTNNFYGKFYRKLKKELSAYCSRDKTTTIDSIETLIPAITAEAVLANAKTLSLIK